MNQHLDDPLAFEQFIRQVRACKICHEGLPKGANPIVQGNPRSRILLISQAPSQTAHDTGVPWNDKSGDRLRRWLGLDWDTFYNPDVLGILPMGFCYPGRGKAGDLPPRPECAPTWHEPFMAHLKNIRLIILIGQYAQKAYLGKKRKKTLTETVRNWQDYNPPFFPIVHPSPRNQIWMKKNEWFEQKIIPELQLKVQEAMVKK